ncbi:MAG: Fur family transcriptional regulator [Bacillota bacterium]|nr:Fur family transcriptional regulator [Bacillota bacterium]
MDEANGQHRKEGAVERLRRARRSMTPARRSVIETMAELPQPFTAGELCDAVATRFPGVGRASVFRTLALLEHLGAVQRVHTGGRESYVLCELTAHHHHLICTRCGRTEEIQLGLDQQLESAAASRGYTHQQHVVEIFGLCPDCQAAGEAERSWPAGPATAGKGAPPASSS